MDNNEIFDRIQDSDYVLIGIGENIVLSDADKDILFETLKDKKYYILSLSGDENIRSSKFDNSKMVLPFCGDDESKWTEYLDWLKNTLNRKLTILELGVGFKYPEVVRFPFEKTVMYNKKAYFYRINDMFYQLPEELSERGEGLKMDVSTFVNELSNATHYATIQSE